MKHAASPEDLDRKLSELLRADKDLEVWAAACRRAHAEVLQDAVEPMSLPGMAPADGEAFGEFRVLREIGRGGMGIVYEAIQVPLDRKVALKILPLGLISSPRSRERFLREAKASASLQHPHIIPVYTFGELGGIPFYSMELIGGRSVDRIVAERKAARAAGDAGAGCGVMLPSFQTLAERMAAVARAIEHAHRRGITHRDLKPANLIEDEDGRILIADFGLARFEGTPSLTLSGQVLGTPVYMSPEQASADGRSVDQRTDVYSLGATLYEMSTLEPPFRGEGPRSILQRVLRDDPAPPRKLEPAIPRDLETIILKAMEKEPVRRYSTAGALAEDLESFADGLPITARPSGPITRLYRRARRRPAAAFACALGAICIVTLGAQGIVQLRQLEADRETRFRQAVQEGMVLLYSFADSLRGGSTPQSLRERPELQAVIRRLERSAGEIPGRPEPRFFLALAHETLDGGAQVDQRLDEALRVDPRHAPSLHHRAFRLARSGLADRARALREEARASAGDSWARDWFEALEAEHAGDWKAAQACYRRLAESTPEPFRGFRYQVCLRRAQADVHVGDFAEARLDLARAEVAWEKRPEVELVRAALLYREGKPSETGAVLRSLLDRERWDQGTLRLALDLFGENALDDGQTVLDLVERGLERYPQDLDLQARRIEAMARAHNPGLGRPADPLSLAFAAVKSHPDSVRVLEALAYVQTAEGHLAEAAATCERALRLEPKDPRLLARLGTVLGRLGDVEGSRRALEDSLAAGKTPVALLELSLRQEELGAFEGAERMLREALRAYPFCAGFKGALPRLLKLQGRWEEARSELRPIAGVRSYYTITEPLFQSLDPESCLPDFNGVQDDALAFASAYCTLGLDDEAERILRRSPAKPNHIFSWCLLRFLQGRSEETFEVIDKLRWEHGALFADEAEQRVPGTNTLAYETAWAAFLAARPDLGIPNFITYCRVTKNYTRALWQRYAPLLLELLPAPELEALVEDFVRDSPTERALQLFRAEVWFRAGRLQESMSELERLLDHTPAACFALADVLQRIHTPEERLEYWTRAAEDDPYSWRRRFCEAEALIEVGRSADALQHLEEIAVVHLPREAGGLIAGSLAKLLSLEEQAEFWSRHLDAASGSGREIHEEFQSRRSDDPIRINCGGEDFIDHFGECWRGDLFGCAGGRLERYRHGVIEPIAEERLHSSAREDGPSFAPRPLYRIPVAPGSYAVNLHFAELQFNLRQPGVRVFDVFLEGQEAFLGVDPNAAPGDGRRRVERFDVEVRDGVLEITLRRRRMPGAISAIEVLPMSQRHYEAERDVAAAALEGRRALPEAIRVLEQAAAERPQAAETRHLLGELLFRNGRIDEAEAAFRSALELDPRRAGTWIRLGDALRAAGRFREALEACREVLKASIEPPFAFWAGLAAASRNALSDEELLRFWKEAKAPRRQDSPARDFAAFFEEQLPLGPAVRLNCGGERASVALVEGAPEVVFEHDRAYWGGGLWSTRAEGLDAVHRSARWGHPRERGFGYSIPLRRGRYRVTLRFAELVDAFQEEGRRVFRVEAEGKTVLDAFDTVKSGGFRRPFAMSFETDATDGLLEIGAFPAPGSPLLNAIEAEPCGKDR
jgi:tetratricopeptide (TPR) repeat protein